MQGTAIVGTSLTLAGPSVGLTSRGPGLSVTAWLPPAGRQRDPPAMALMCCCPGPARPRRALRIAAVPMPPMAAK